MVRTRSQPRQARSSCARDDFENVSRGYLAFEPGKEARDTTSYGVATNVPGTANRGERLPSEDPLQSGTAWRGVRKYNHFSRTFSRQIEAAARAYNSTCPL